jgi:DNA-binding GntR family transcriptional regulator
MNSIEEVNLVRAALEGVAARLAAEKISPEDIAELEQTINEMKFYTLQKDATKLIEFNDRFHKLIRSFAQNNYIFKQIEAVRSYDRSFRKRALAHSDEFDRAFKEHEQIFLRIKAKDPDGSEAAVREHIRRTILYVKQSSTMQK